MNRIAVLNTFYTSARSRALLPVHPVLLEDGAGLILVDCGGSVQSIREQALENGMDLKSLTRIIVTHHDQDHINALAALKRSFPRAKVFASRTEAEYISGKKDFVRLTQAKELHKTLPPERKHEAGLLMEFYASIEKAEVDVPLDPPVTFPWCGGLRILFTPGHMPGHISVYLKESNTLIAGDALVCGNGRLSIDAAHTLDMRQAKESARQFLHFSIERLVCYHGGEFTGPIRESILAALKE